MRSARILHSSYPIGAHLALGTGLFGYRSARSKAQSLGRRGTLSLLLVIVLLPNVAEAGFWPSGAQWREAALDAVTDPYIWIPAGGAAVTGLTGLDHTISNWAVDNTPVFGSPESANDASDYLRTATHVGMLGTAMAVPEPWDSTLKRVLVEEAALVATTAATLGLKEASHRQRPDESDEESFPSGHSSQAFAFTAMGSMNVDALPLQEPIQTGLRLGLTGLAAGTAWARVEAGVHFPSDVLFGAALGNFVGHLIQGAFVGEQEYPYVNFYVGDHTAFLSLNFRVQ